MSHQAQKRQASPAKAVGPSQEPAIARLHTLLAGSTRVLARDDYGNCIFNDADKQGLPEPADVRKQWLQELLPLHMASCPIAALKTVRPFVPCRSLTQTRFCC